MTMHMNKICIFFLAILFFSCTKNESVSTFTDYYFTHCDRATVSGEYFKDSALTSSNEIALEVQANKTGKWNIKTETVNGMSFSGSGEFSTKGLHTIALKGSGKPLTAGLSHIRLDAGLNYCTILIHVDTIAVAPCTPSDNSISGLGSGTFYSVSRREFGGSYQVKAFGNSADLSFEFANATVPKSGAYRIKPLASDFYTGDVRVSLVALSIWFQSSEGVVYVDNVNGKLTVTFCDVRFLGTNGISTYNSTASARVVK